MFSERRSPKNEQRKSSRRGGEKDVSFIDRRNNDRRAMERRRQLPELQETVWEQYEQLHRIKRSLYRRVVITGIGVVAPNGIGVAPFWSNLKKGKSCVDYITRFDTTGHPSKVGAEINDFRPTDFMKKNDASNVSRSAQFALAAARLAMEDGKLSLAPKDRNTAGVIVGTGVSGVEFVIDEVGVFNKFGVKKINPYTAVIGFPGAASSIISIQLGLHGPSLSLATGCVGSHDAVGNALSLIRHGVSDIIFTGGTDACLTSEILHGFCKIGAITTKWNHEPACASRPFTKDRDGFVLSEGAAMFIFEELNHALKRGASIYAEVAGYNATCDAYHIVKPLSNGWGSAEAMRRALKDADVAPHEIQYINAHGTSTQLNDSAETAAIKSVFRKDAPNIPVSSIKSMIGHAVGAAGAMGVAAAALAIRDGFVPPTINYTNPDPRCDLDYVPNKGREVRVDAALCNSVGFGAKNAALVLKKLS